MKNKVKKKDWFNAGRPLIPSAKSLRVFDAFRMGSSRFSRFGQFNKDSAENQKVKT